MLCFPSLADRPASGAAATEQKQEEAETTAENERRLEQCQMYRNRLQSFLQSRGLYQEDDAGDRTYLDDDQILAAHQAVRDKITETCS